MNAPAINTRRSPHPLIWAAGIAIIVFCAIGIAALMGWLPGSIGAPATGVAAADKTGPLPAAAGAPPTPAKPAAAKTHSAVSAPPAPARVAGIAVTAPKCPECGVIESTREVETRGEASGLGAVGGAVAGGVLGSQVGGGRGKDVATVAGAVGGAVAGNEIEKRMKSVKSYEVTVRLEDGSSRVIREANQTAWRTGDKVKLVDGALRSN